ncbi:TetR/AcrR family transcriptional regulator [Herbiconiux sp. UC225_62]|uniref:TetR/AcrR family transcriptional regulator n=1 Tax=Herbiconiux sp. UC225_62 TaxID=3350168 RepID=UPI0036D4379C
MSTTRTPGAADPGGGSGTSYHHGNLRSALLERAEATIEVDGVESLSLRQLARDLGVSHGAPGRHFRDKQALLDALAYDGFVAMNARLDAAVASEGSVAERLGAVAHAYVAFAVEHRALLQVMYATKHAPDASPRLQRIGHASLAKTTDLIRAAQASGDVASGDPDRLALVAFAAVHGVATLATNDLLDGVPVDDATRATVDLLWAGLTAGLAAGVTPPER